MSAARGRRSRPLEAWPGYVDVLSTLLMVIVFVLMVFVVAQMFLSLALSGRDDALAKLNAQVLEIASMLAMEQKTSEDLRAQLSQMSGELASSTAERDQLKDQLTVVIGERDAAQRQSALSEEQAKKLAEAYQTIDADRERIAALVADIAALQSLKDDLSQKLLSADDEKQKITDEARLQMEILNQQTLALRQELARISALLEASEAKTREQEVQIVDLGNRLNAALASKVEELARYRSEFFGRLREVLGNRDDIRIVGDRFVFQSEVLFASGSATIEEAGKAQLDELATTLILLSLNIPEDLDWVLRIDGHTDKRPIATYQFPSNWELSTARAVAVAKYLIDRGLPPDRLVTAGYAEFRPLDPADTDEAFTKNRRIEFKLDQR
ncbi:chemotaxis protein MotB [Dongia mobilis]|uniref:Chemotaxis protein MotB n=1 Tax=Dongia mobilis TaxID=578943 RepID=A0A4R6WRM1_9PROT|nr:peptidoglycan -binding protein [Dongia mobilis]TDQ84245.1 chemotaxis protein MotB [Dongia mobilis]